MKKVFIIICFVFLSKIVISQNDTLKNNLVYKTYNYVNGNTSSQGYLKNNIPEGFWKAYYKSGIKKSEGIWKNGKLDSIWIFYDQIGDTIEKINYYIGKKNGYHYKYFKNEESKNKVEEKILFIEGKRDGYSFSFFENGNIKTKNLYKNDKKNGISYEYDENGRIISVFRYKNNEIIYNEKINRYNNEGLKEGIWKSFFKSGSVKEEKEYKNGKLNGYYKIFNKEGDLKEIVKYKNGEIDFEQLDSELGIESKEEYDSVGNIKFQGSFKNNKPIGIHRYFNSKSEVIESKTYNLSGNLIAEGICLVDGNEEGKWIYYYNNMTKKAEGSFDKGKKQGLWSYYYENGKIQQKGAYSKNRFTGAWVWYYKSGYTLKEEYYINGKLDGDATEYDETGEIISKGNYIEGLKEGEWIIAVGDQKYVGNYVMDQKDGIWKSYYINESKISFIGKYLQGSPDGKHTYYYPNSNIKEEQYYNEGEKIKSWSKYGENGKLIIVIQYRDGNIYKINGEKINNNDDKM